MVSANVVFTWLCVGFLLPTACKAMPSLMVPAGESKCFVYEAAMDTTIKIDYEAPDIILDKEDPHFSPSYITVDVRPSNRVIETKHHEAPVRSHLRPTKEVLEKNAGRIKHKFEVDGEADICFKAPDRPRRGAHNSHEENQHYHRFTYHIRLADGLDGDEDEDNIPKADIDGHLSHMEKEFQRIQRGMQTILREAEFSKEREALFHKQTESMHSAAMFWPVVQVCVLLMTGFTQASHIVQFFKRRRII
ncbi:hypothetical protein ACA910_012497 [Epithemia clementina (nom. ined.)]